MEKMILNKKYKSAQALKLTIRALAVGLLLAVGALLLNFGALKPAQAAEPSLKTRLKTVEITELDPQAQVAGIKIVNQQVVRAAQAQALKIPHLISATPGTKTILPITLPKDYKIVSLNGINSLYFTNANSELVGMIDYAYSFASDRSAVEAKITVNETGLVFEFPTPVSGPLHIAYLNATGNAGLDLKPLERADFVTIPANYIYDPALGTLNDYCTKSPDSFGAADFRGPCARHDLCYEGKGCASKSCDDALYSDLATNCRAAYGSWNPMLASCLATANVYWGAVRGAHIFSACE